MPRTMSKNDEFAWGYPEMATSGEPLLAGSVDEEVMLVGSHIWLSEDHLDSQRLDWFTG